MADATVKEPEVNLELALEHGLNEEEFEMIKTRLGRVPVYRIGSVFCNVE